MGRQPSGAHFQYLLKIFLAPNIIKVFKNMMANVLFQQTAETNHKLVGNYLTASLSMVDKMRVV